MSEAYRVHGYVRVPEATLEEFIEALEVHTALTRAEPGCLQFEIRQRPEVPEVFDVREAFVDRAAFLAHQERASRTPWKALTSDVERHYRLPT